MSIVFCSISIPFIIGEYVVFDEHGPLIRAKDGWQCPVSVDSSLTNRYSFIVAGTGDTVGKSKLVEVSPIIFSSHYGILIIYTLVQIRISGCVLVWGNFYIRIIIWVCINIFIEYLCNLYDFFTFFIFCREYICNIAPRKFT